MCQIDLQVNSTTYLNPQKKSMCIYNIHILILLQDNASCCYKILLFNEWHLNGSQTNASFSNYVL